VSSTYNITLQLFRGKDRALDQIGTFVLKTTTATYSSWTLVESEFLSSSVITYSGALADRNFIGWAAIQITSSVALDVDDIVLRPKIRTIDISDSQVTTAKIADSNVTTVKIADNNITTAKIPKAVKAIVKGHLDGTSDATTLESLVDGTDTTLHSHTVTSLVLFTQIRAYSTSISVTAGTWSIEAFMVCHQSQWDPATLYINSISTASSGNFGNTDGTGFNVLFGARTVTVGSPTAVPVSITITNTFGDTPLLYITATRTS